jgi:hypothetical protein
MGIVAAQDPEAFDAMAEAARHAFDNVPLDQRPF